MIVEVLRDGSTPLTADSPGIKLDDAGRLTAVSRREGVLPVVLSVDPPMPRVEELASPAEVKWQISVGTDIIMAGTVQL